MVKKVISLLILFVCFEYVQARENGLPVEPEVQSQSLGRYYYSTRGGYFCPSDHAIYVPVFPHVDTPQENSFSSEQQQAVLFLPAPSRITYVHFYNGRFEASINSLKSYCDSPVFVSPPDFLIHQNNPEVFFRLKIGDGAYNTTQEIAQQMRTLHIETFGNDYLCQLKSIVYKILNLTQIENCLWNEYAVHDGCMCFVPILGQEWCNALHSYQQILVSKLGQFHPSAAKKGTLPYLRGELVKIWGEYKENNLALWSLNNNAIQCIEGYFGGPSVFVGDPIIRHELEYRKRYQRFKYWMIFAQG